MANELGIASTAIVVIESWTPNVIATAVGRRSVTAVISTPAVIQFYVAFSLVLRGIVPGRGRVDVACFRFEFADFL